MIRIPYIKVLTLTNDFLFATTDVAIWSTVEPGLGIVAAGAITLRPLFRTFYAISTRNKSSNPPSTSKRSRARNSHMAAFQMPGSNSQHTNKASVGSSGDSEEIQLSRDVGRMGTGKGAAMVTSCPFADENEVRGVEREGGSDGIQVSRTVEVWRGERFGDGDDDGESVRSVGVGSVPNMQWPQPGTGSSDKDMV